MEIHTDFEGGALGTLLDVTPASILAELYRERAEDGVNTQASWFYCRFDYVENQPFTVVLRGLEDVYDGRPSHSINDRDRPVVSDDGVTWRRVMAARFDAAQSTLVIPLVPRGDTLWLAALEPYLTSHLAALADAIRGHPAVQMATLGPTAGGRDLPCWTIGRDDAERCVWLIARQHAWETHTSWCMDGLVRWLLSAEAAELRQRCVFKVLPMMDPDGVVRGGTRVNAYGFDLNRHWNETDPRDAQHRQYRPEISAAKRALADWLATGRRVDLLLNLHDTHNDVLLVPPSSGEAAILHNLLDCLTAGSYTGELRVVPKTGTSSSTERFVSDTYGIPCACLELGTAELPSYGRHPTAADRVQFGAELGRAMAAVI